MARGQNESFNPRYLVILFPLALPVLGLLLARCWNRPWLGWPATAGAVAVAAMGLGGFLTRAAPDPQLWDPLPLVRLLQEEAQEDDLVVFDSLGQAGHYLRLTPRPVPWTYVTGPDLYFHEKLPEPAPAGLNWPGWVRTVWVVLYRGGGRHGQALLRELEDRAYPAQRAWLGDSLVARVSLPRQPVRPQAGGARFVNGIELAAACWPDEPVAGGSINLELIWRGVEPGADHYKVFVHAVNPMGQVVAQHDAPLQNDRQPTSGSPTSELARDFHGLPLPPEASADEYVLDVGLYDGKGREKLLDGSDRITLGPILVEEISRQADQGLLPLLLDLGTNAQANPPHRERCTLG
ncbi:MAG: hypothetical protein HYY05_03720 [Chloroflexi bacterium]|nr:hypothetical protein [Chloroflexota bacterium]